MLVTIQNVMLLFSPCKRCPVPALMRFSAPVKKHWLGSFSIVLPPSGLRGFVPVVRDRWEQGRPGGPREGGVWYPPLPVMWVVVLFGLVAFPVWSCLAPPRLWGGSVFYRGMVWLLPLVSSNVIVTCLVPSPSSWGGACGRFGWPRPAWVGQCVLQRYGMIAAAC